MKQRKVKIIRKTKETDIKLELNLDGCGKYSINTTIPFIDHMLSLFAKHSFFDLKIVAKGDTEVDYHHLIEDIGIVLGEGINKALGDKVGINRFGYSILPMDEALVITAIDLSNRAHLTYDLDIKHKNIKLLKFDIDLIEEFFLAFTRSARLTLHIKKIAGKNIHHIIEAVFKSFAISLREAIKRSKIRSIPSTKGKL